jgi:WD40 repeat protein
MAQIEIVVTLPGKKRRNLPIMVDDMASVETLVARLVEHWRFPLNDLSGQPVHYRLRTGHRVLPDGKLLAQTGVGSGARCVLEADMARRSPLPILPFHQKQSQRFPQASRWLGRRTVLIGGVLAGFALTGLFSGAAAAFAGQYLEQHGGAQPTSPSVRLRAPRLLQGHRGLVRVVAWGSDGRIASGAEDGQLVLWSAAGTKQIHITHPSTVSTVAWSPDSQRLVTAAGIQMRFFDTRAFGLLAHARHAHMRAITGLAWSSFAGQPVVSVSEDQRALVWETTHYTSQRAFTQHTTAITGVAAHADGMVATASQGGVARIWSIDTLQEIHPLYQDGETPMLALAFAPAGPLLALGGSDGRLRLWTNSQLCQLAGPAGDGGMRCLDVPVRHLAHRGAIRTLAWSQDGRLLATGGDDHQLAIWFWDGQIFRLLTSVTHDAPVVSLAWSPDGRQIAAASGNVIVVWTMQ